MTIVMGFASYRNNSYELILRDEETGVETTLYGILQKGQLQIVDKLLPTCVFVPIRNQRK